LQEVKTMGVKVALTIEQVAETLTGMNRDELKSLELLLDKKTTGKILKRRKEARAGKTVAIQDLKSLKNL
jgi:hypothetical protein